MNKHLLFIPVFILTLSGCNSENKIFEKTEYLRWVGDIEHDSKIDNIDFKLCNEDYQVLQYFNIGMGPVYKGEKKKLINAFNSNFEPVTEKKQNGWIRIRFIVNCEGHAGRFRILQSDNNYEDFNFDRKIITQLIEIAKGIENWEILYSEGIPIDYYMYLVFKISDGHILEILP
ncbi:hypothetical protein [Lunatimonas lonarensis]|uniref:hypothetical protein n=1 Tax=Lunatimonas lonarensis TaxID=1232681 RepID=UPI000565B909|nr:hypothetical protein [Lunatimonas lonarensis]